MLPLMRPAATVSGAGFIRSTGTGLSVTPVAASCATGLAKREGRGTGTGPWDPVALRLVSAWALRQRSWRSTTAAG